LRFRELESYTYTLKGFWVNPVESEIGAALCMPSVLTALSDTKHHKTPTKPKM
jgi:hypothetical protein